MDRRTTREVADNAAFQMTGKIEKIKMMLMKVGPDWGNQDFRKW